ncbi:Quinoprotein alcohol dehydrogenase-like protein [Gracilaria domingensis]|nr:Quinoprotein alcohol dehydrogenase-like protein [Gracilaria domingensis]
MANTLTLKQLYPGVPNTVRGEASHISADPTAQTSLIAYASGRVAVVRSIQDPLNARVFSLHSAPVTCARFTPDGKQVASADEHGFVRIWNVDTGVQKNEMQVYNGAVRDLSFTPDGKYLMLAGESRGAFGKVVKIPSGGSAGVCGGHTKNGISCDAIKGYVVTGSEDMTVGLFKGPPVREIDIPTFFKHHNGFINDVRFSPSAKFLAIASSDRTCSIVDVESKQVVCTTAEHVASVTGIVWFDDSNLMTSSNDKTNKFWSIPDGKCLRTITYGKEVMDMQVGCAHSKKGGETVSVSLRPQINVVEAGQDSVTKVFRGHCKQIIGLAAVGNNVYTADYSGLMVAWEMDVGSADLHFTGKGPVSSVCAIAANEDIVANVGLDGKVFVTPRSTLKFAKPVVVKGGGVDITVPMSQTPAYSAVMVNETRLVTINSEATAIEAEMKFGNGETGTAVAVNNDGLIAVGFEVSGGSGELRFFTVNGSKFTEAGNRMRMPSAPNRIAFSPDGECLAVGEKSRRVKLYNATTRETVTGGGLVHTARVDAIAFSLDGSMVASGGMDGSVAVWPVNSEDEPLRLKTAHRSGVTGIAFVSENCIVTSGGDSCVRTWNM